MTKEMKQNYTLRISQANKSELVVIIYEMLLTYIEDARTAHADGDTGLFAGSLRKAENCIRELMASLHMDYVLAGKLLSLYVYAVKLLSKAKLHNSTKELAEVEKMMRKLHDAYAAVSREDTSDSVMENTQTVYAGLTYGKNQLMESLSNEGSLRGLRV